MPERWIASSPRERGSSPNPLESRDVLGVVPARAGVIRSRLTSRATSPGRPRASGGHPAGLTTAEILDGSSPRERGSSVAAYRELEEAMVVPARAGVIPGSSGPRIRRRRRPRASGGHPDMSADYCRLAGSSPRERGSSRHR